jgi:hypothetical protein
MNFSSPDGLLSQLVAQQDDQVAVANASHHFTGPIEGPLKSGERLACGFPRMGVTGEVPQPD